MCGPPKCGAWVPAWTTHRKVPGLVPLLPRASGYRWGSLRQDEYRASSRAKEPGFEPWAPSFLVNDPE